MVIKNTGLADNTVAEAIASPLSPPPAPKFQDIANQLQRLRSLTSSSQAELRVDLNGRVAPQNASKSGLSRQLLTPAERVKEPGFTDPFSTLATDVKSKRGYYFSIDKRSHVTIHSRLSIFERIFTKIFYPEKYLHWEKENRIVVKAYKQFLIEEYGAAKVRQVEYAYRHYEHSINLDKLFETGSPLTADIIYLYNIGVNNIEQQDVEAFMKKAETLKDELEPSERLDQFLACKVANWDIRRGPTGTLEIKWDNTQLTVREARGILKGETLEKFCSKDPAAFNHSLDALMPDLSKDTIYGGKKIHRVIRGAYHEGYINVNFQPWLDQQEVLQLFPDLRKAQGEAYYELLSKSLVKKHLVREDADSKNPWRVGSLFPAPDGKNGERRWYRVDEAVDSGHGKFYYVLRPAHEDYDQTLPVILLYRSTASDPYAMGGGPTVARDVYPYAPAGYLYRHSANDHLDPFFEKFTTPMHPSPDAESEGKKETRPLVLAGDSLGGADAQIDTVRYLAEMQRVPVTDMTVFCHSAPQIKRSDTEKFIKYIEDSKESRKTKLSVHHWVEQGDPVPSTVTYVENGKKCKSAHLGYGLTSEKDGLSVGVRFFTPLATSTASSIRDLNPHERRYGLAKQGEDYEVERLSVCAFDEGIPDSRLGKFLRSSAFFDLADNGWRAKRRILGRRGVEPENINGLIYAKYGTL